MKKRLDDLQKRRQVIMMHPVTRLGNGDYLPMVKRRCPAIAIWIGRMTVSPANEERRAGDSLPDLARVVGIEIVGR